MAPGASGVDTSFSDVFGGRTGEADLIPPLVLQPDSVRSGFAREDAEPRGYFGKRMIDIIAAAVLLLALAPLIGYFWTLVRMTSAGPGLHWSKRVGRNGRTFWMPKLRTMTEDAPLVAREALTAANDVTTPLGRFLRKNSLDELPQLWSILVGEMSFIGPRPLLPNDPGSAARRQFPQSLAVRPGLSGLAQINGRNHVPPRRKARYDAFYAERLDLGMDLYVLKHTALILFRRAGGGVLMH